jgi:hypothetical protein
LAFRHSLEVDQFSIINKVEPKEKYCTGCGQGGRC